METPTRTKILFVITKSNWGGAQRYVYALATHVAHAGADVVVALGGTGESGASAGLLAEKLRAAGIRTIFLKSFMRDISFASDIRAFFELRRIIASEKPDVLHLNSSKAGGIGTLAGRLAGVRSVVFTAHGWPFWEKRNVFSLGLIYFFSWLTALFATRVIVISEYDRRVAQSMPFIAHKISRIYNGVELNPTLGTGERIRSAFPPGVKITGTIGELNKNKNQIALIEDARNDPNKYVAIVGEGELHNFLENKIREYKLEDRVKLFGFIPAAEVLQGFDEFALPSLKEGLPYVLLEARAAGLPIEANRVGGVSEILDAPDLQEFSLEHMVQKTAALY